MYKLIKYLDVFIVTNDKIIRDQIDEMFVVNDLHFVVTYMSDLNGKNNIIEIFNEDYINKTIYDTYIDKSKTTKNFEVMLEKEMSEEDAFYFKLKYDNIFDNLELIFIEIKD